MESLADRGTNLELRVWRTKAPMTAAPPKEVSLMVFDIRPMVEVEVEAEAAAEAKASDGTKCGGEGRGGNAGKEKGQWK